ncbi:hypothetical protein K469DRAFT_308941 [Zopfia rhizophila CBS 207.26]|uniref:Uncharacterized protein n=1 Tax=Zopfia rhizophila CBS 207.26 TaxID=1314779 RepID=A0A6A6EQV1_9PEZI|nr:hypothetical protein K469DRAFT_308941 [Zopfia rhizophila CBS 207.26]
MCLEATILLLPSGFMALFSVRSAPFSIVTFLIRESALMMLDYFREGYESFAWTIADRWCGYSNDVNSKNTSVSLQDPFSVEILLISWLMLWKGINIVL